MARKEVYMWLAYRFCLFDLAVPEIKFKALHMLGRCSITDPYLQPVLKIFSTHGRLNPQAWDLWIHRVDCVSIFI
jgi:hypothetical protein